MQLGIFGGTFDPIHYGHLLLAESCREQCRLDAVWFLPAFVPPHKQAQAPTPVAQRIAMLELAIAGNPAFSVCRYEADRGSVGFTVDTLEHLHVENPGDDLFLLLGADTLADLPNWRSPARVCELALPVAVRRPGCQPADFNRLCAILSPERFEAAQRLQVETPEIGISSTNLRQRAELGQSLRYQTPRAVEMYISTERLYTRRGQAMPTGGEDNE
jgi:nicotinate-nucleotide adenylyltransferase